MSSIVPSGSSLPSNDVANTVSALEHDAAPLSGATEAPNYDSKGNPIAQSAALTPLYDYQGHYVGSYGFDPSSGYFSAWDASGKETSLQNLIQSNNLPASSEPIAADGKSGLVYNAQGKLVGINVAGYSTKVSTPETQANSISGLRQIRSASGVQLGSIGVQGSLKVWGANGAAIDASTVLQQEGFTQAQIDSATSDIQGSNGSPTTSEGRAVEAALTQYLLVQNGLTQQTTLTINAQDSSDVTYLATGTAGTVTLLDASGNAISDRSQISELYNDHGEFAGAVGIDPTTGAFAAWDSAGNETSLSSLPTSKGLPAGAEAVGPDGNNAVLFNVNGQPVGLNVAGFVTSIYTGSQQSSISGLRQVYSKEGAQLGSFGLVNGSFQVFNLDGTETDATSILESQGFSSQQIANAKSALASASDAQGATDSVNVEDALTKYLLGSGPSEQYRIERVAGASSTPSVGAAPTYGGVQWTAITLADGSTGYYHNAGSGGAQYDYYFGPDFKLYYDLYPGEVHPGDIQSNQIGDVRSYFAQMNGTVNAAPTWAGLTWTPLTASDGLTGYTAAAGNGKYFYLDSNASVYLNAYSGEVHSSDKAANLQGWAPWYFPTAGTQLASIQVTPNMVADASAAPIFGADPTTWPTTTPGVQAIVDAFTNLMANDPSFAMYWTAATKDGDTHFTFNPADDLEGGEGSLSVNFDPSDRSEPDAIKLAHEALHLYDDKYGIDSDVEFTQGNLYDGNGVLIPVPTLMRSDATNPNSPLIANISDPPTAERMNAEELRGEIAGAVAAYDLHLTGQFKGPDWIIHGDRMSFADFDKFVFKYYGKHISDIAKQVDFLMKNVTIGRPPAASSPNPPTTIPTTVPSGFQIPTTPVQSAPPPPPPPGPSPTTRRQSSQGSGY